MNRSRVTHQYTLRSARTHTHTHSDLRHGLLRHFCCFSTRNKRRVSGVREEMTANKNSKSTAKAGGAKAPQEIPDRCQSGSPPTILAAVNEPCRAQFSEKEDTGQKSRYTEADIKVQSQRNWSQKTASLRSNSLLSTETHSGLTKAKSIGCLDKKLSIYKPSGGEDREQKEVQLKDGPPGGDTVCPGPLSWSTLSLTSSSSAKYVHKRTLSLSCNGTGTSSATIRKKISEWECRNVVLPRMSLCLDNRPGGGSECCPSLLSSPCSEKAFDFKSMRRMSTAFSECSYPETEEEDGTLDRECTRRFQKREGQKTFIRSRKETSAVLNRIQKIEQALKESPSAPPKYLSNCYGLEKPRQKSFTISSRHEDLDSTCDSKRSSICSVATEPDTVYPGSEKLLKFRQRFSVASFTSDIQALPCTQGSSGPPGPPGAPVNPLPKPKRTFEYDANRSHKDSSPSNGIPPNPDTRVPATVNTPVNSFRTPDRESCESEDAVSLPSSYPSSQTENGTASTELHSRPGSKSTVEENAYEDITGDRVKGLSSRARHHDLSWTSVGREEARMHIYSFKFLGIHISEDLSWTTNISSLDCHGRGDIRDRCAEAGRKRQGRGRHVNKKHKQKAHGQTSDSWDCCGWSRLEPMLCHSALERPTKLMREAEQRLKAIPQFCFPDAKDWSPVSEYSSETFSFMLTGEDGSRRFGYCRRLLPSGKAQRLPEVYCVISRLGCFNLFSKILDEVERRRGISAALVYPFMRSLMESPFPAPGKTIKVKTFLPGAGNEVMELRRPMDSRLEHVDFESLFSCLSIRQVVCVFASLLLERRVIFVADKLSVLSSCAHAVVALL
ncbi:hypothetical protein Q7C36_001531 [Tachysurus vachellii]|uniref:UDENN domain-containing protein n=1 Tax=Tachysurus vachellii TaxID=175792 RepID=A0AA88TD61_TACVA|nr:hypothetical protein Q7C36_001531 [Tachysurus vachellii]